MVMIIGSKTRKLNVKYTPLDAICEIVPYGGVPDRQAYNSRDGGWSPNYKTGAHLCLFPHCNAINPNSETVKNYVNDELTSIAWYELVYNSASKKYVRGTQISTGDDYEVVENSSDGLVKGMLIVKRNSSVNDPIRLEFEASYTNPLSKQIIRYLGQKTVFCDDTERPIPVLHVSPMVSVWNPLTDAKNVTFEAMLTDGKTDVTNSKNTRFFWYRKTNIHGETYSLEQITGSADKDIDVVSLPTKTAIVDGEDVTVSGNKLTIDRDLIGDAEYYVCKAMYRVDGLKSSDSLGDTDPSEEFAVLRKMPAYEPSYSGVGDTDDENLSYINPTAHLFVKNTEINNIEEFFKIRWHVKNPSDTDFKVVAEGLSPQIPFVNGMAIFNTMEDLGATKIFVDDNGNYLVDEDGSIIVGK